MCIDEHDNLWIASYMGSRITHWDPRTGSLLRTIIMPCREYEPFHSCNCVDAYR